MFNIDIYGYVNYYEEYEGYEDKITSAAVNAKSHKVLRFICGDLDTIRNDIHQAISNLSSSTSDYVINMFSNFLSESNKGFENINQFLKGDYIIVEQVYIDLKLNLDKLKQNDERLKQLCKKKPQKNEYNIPYGDQYGNITYSFDSDKYNKDLKKWQGKVLTLKGDCVSLKERIDEYMSYLNSISAAEPAYGRTGIPAPSSGLPPLKFDSLDKLEDSLLKLKDKLPTSPKEEEYHQRVIDGKIDIGDRQVEVLKDEDGRYYFKDSDEQKIYFINLDENTGEFDWLLMHDSIYYRPYRQDSYFKSFTEEDGAKIYKDYHNDNEYEEAGELKIDSSGYHFTGGYKCDCPLPNGDFDLYSSCTYHKLEAGELHIYIDGNEEHQEYTGGYKSVDPKYGMVEAEECKQTFTTGIVDDKLYCTRTELKYSGELKVTDKDGNVTTSDGYYRSCENIDHPADKSHYIGSFKKEFADGSETIEKKSSTGIVEIEKNGDAEYALKYSTNDSKIDFGGIDESLPQETCVHFL